MAGYWDEVGKKLKGLGKALLDAAAPVAVDYAVTAAVEKACSVVEEKLGAFYVRTLINAGISFAANLAGVLVLIFKPFGVQGSRYVAVGFFAAAFVFWLVRTVLFVRNYGKTAWAVGAAVWKERSVYGGIERYVLENFPLIALAYGGMEVAAERLPCLKDVPRVSEFVERLVKIFWKRVAVFAGIFAVYTVGVVWILKGVLVRMYF